MNKETLLAVGRVLKELKAEYASKFIAVDTAVKDAKVELFEKLTQLKTSINSELAEVEESGAVATRGVIATVEDVTTTVSTLDGVVSELVSHLATIQPYVDEALRSNDAKMAEQFDKVFSTLQTELSDTEHKLSALIEKGNTFTCVEISKQEAAFEETRAEDLTRLSSTEEKLVRLQDTNDVALTEVRNSINSHAENLRALVTEVRKDLIDEQVKLAGHQEADHDIFTTALDVLNDKTKETVEALEITKAEITEIIETQRLDMKTLEERLDTQRSAQALELAAVVTPLQEHAVKVAERFDAQEERITRIISNGAARDQDYLKDLKGLRGDLYNKFAAFQESVEAADHALEEALADLEANTNAWSSNTQQRIAGVQDSVGVLSNKIKGVSEQFGETLSEQVAAITASIAGVREALNAAVAEEAVARAVDVGNVQELIESIPDLAPALNGITEWSKSVEERWQAFEKQVFDTVSEVGLGANTQIEELSETVSDAVKGLADDQNTLAENLSARIGETDSQLETVRSSVGEVRAEVAEVTGHVTAMHEVHTLNLEHPRAIAGRVYRYDNALWMCHKDTTELPSVSNPDWELRQDALTGLSVDQDTPGTLAVVETWAGGKTKTHVIELPHINYLKTWDEKLLYNKYDSVIDDGHRWVAVKDNPSGHPHKSGDWFLFGMRGPQGKRGQKGERGLQGAPGETHSVDTIVKALIAFKERGEGVELGKFRGPWVYQSSYARTDVVTHTEAIYVALVDNDGMMAPTGSPSEPFNDQWMLVYNVSVPQIPKNAVLYTSADEFIPGETVVPAYTQMSRNRWLMIANKATSDYPDPQNSGTQSADMPESPTWDVDPEHIGVVRTIHRYTLTQPGFVKALEVAVPDTSPDIDYRFYAFVQEPGLDVRSIAFDHPVLVADSWVLLVAGDSPNPAGTVFTVVSQALNSAENTTWEHNWDYSGTSTTATPAAGDWNRRSQQDVVRVSFEAEDGDQQLDLNAVTPGSLIRFSNAANVGQYWEYYVTGVTENTADSCFEYDVDLNAVGPSGDIPGGATCVVTATIPTPLATKYKQITGYWLTGQPDWAAVEGAVEFDGVAQAAEEDNAHGIRLTFQPAYVSPDWDFLAHTT